MVNPLTKNNIKSLLFPSASSGRLLFAVVCVLVTALLIDRALLRVYSYTAYPGGSDVLFITFFLIAFISMVGQYAVMAFVRAKVQGFRTTLNLSFIQFAVTVCQYFLISLLIVIIIQISLYSHYSTSILTSLTLTSYGLSVITLGFLAFRLFSWFTTKKSYIVLAYGLSSAVFVLSSIFLMMFLAYILSNLPDYIQLHHHNLPYFNNPGSPTFITYNGYVILSILSFVTLWAATAMVLHSYSKAIGKIKYWVLVSLPLVYFLSQFLTFFLNLFSPWLDQNPAYFAVLLSIVFSVSKSVGGILFGLAFWTMARSLKKPNILKEYLTITATGFVLLFVSDQAISLIFVPYPPFGLSSVALVGVASYLIFIGLYFSAVSIARNIELRKTVLASARRQFDLLGSIGTAQMEGHLDKIVTSIVRDNPDIIKIKDVDPTLEEIKDYTREVLEEISRFKSQHSQET